MQSIIITLREGIEAALAVGIILTYLNRLKRDDLKKGVYWGIGVAVVLSIVIAVVFHFIKFDPDNEILEGSMYLIAGIFVVSLIIWMNKASKGVSNEITGQLSQIVHKSAGQIAGVFFFTLFMVFREGVETVIFIYTLASGSSAITNVTGSIFGIILAAAFAYLFMKGSARIDISKLFKVLNIILYILVVRLFAGAIHEFGEKQLIPLGPSVANILGYIVRDNSIILISMFLITLPLLMMVLSREKKDINDLSGVEKRRRLAEMHTQRNIRIATISIIVAIDLLLGYEYIEALNKKVIDPVPKKVEVKGEDVRLPVSDLGENVLNKYSYTTDDGKVIRFVLIKRKDGTIGSGLDACMVCGSKGYYQEYGNEENITCRNCNAPISISTVGFPGGCNPIELKTEVKNDQIIIKAEDLLKSKKEFFR